MVLVIFVGSVASGKTFTARALEKILADRGFVVKYIGVNVNHGFAYLVTRVIVSLLRYKYVGNHYLTIRFNNEAFFCKYLPLMQILDTLYMPIKYIISLRTFIFFNKFRRREYVVLLDEYYINSIVDYLYFSRKLCSRVCRSDNGIKVTYKLFYSLAFRLVLLSLKKDKTLIMYMSRYFNESVRGWLLREKTRLVDVNHIMFRNLATKVMLGILKQYIGDNVSFQNYMVQDFGEVSKRIIEDTLKLCELKFETADTVYRP